MVMDRYCGKYLGERAEVGGVRDAHRANVAHIRQPRPDFGRGFQVKVLIRARNLLSGSKKLTKFFTPHPLLAETRSLTRLYFKHVAILLNSLLAQRWNPGTPPPSFLLSSLELSDTRSL